MSGTELMGIIGFFIMLMGTVASIWWRVEGKIGNAKDKADKVGDDLAVHKLHVAEAYAEKSVLKEVRDEILGAVGGVKEDIRHLSDRIDSIHK